MEKINNYQVETIKVCSTTEYDKFISGTNRPLYPRNVENIKQSLIDNGYDKTLPIKVNPDTLEVIDGQHRLEACKQLQIPVYYIESSETVLETIQKNISMKKWTIEDYIVSNAKQGNANCIRIIELSEKYQCDMQSLLKVCGKQYRLDKVIDTDIDEVQAKEGIRLVKMLEQYIYVTSPYKKAVHNIIIDKNYNGDLMEQKLKINALRLINVPTVRDAVNILTDIYNYKNRNSKLNKI